MCIRDRYNGMWKLEKLMQAFPARWELYQIVTTVDATTFELYSNNIGPIDVYKRQALKRVEFLHSFFLTFFPKTLDCKPTLSLIM